MKVHHELFSTEDGQLVCFTLDLQAHTLTFGDETRQLGSRSELEAAYRERAAGLFATGSFSDHDGRVNQMLDIERGAERARRLASAGDDPLARRAALWCADVALAVRRHVPATARNALLGFDEVSCHRVELDIPELMDVDALDDAARRRLRAHGLSAAARVVRSDADDVFLAVEPAEVAALIDADFEMGDIPRLMAWVCARVEQEGVATTPLYCAFAEGRTLDLDEWHSARDAHDLRVWLTR